MRRRVFLAIGLAFLFMVAVIAIATRLVLLEGFRRLERQHLEQSMGQARGVLEDDLASLARTNRDWSAWNETYDFVETGAPRYIEDNLDEGVFSNLRVSAMLWVRASGRVTWGVSYDLRGGATAGFPDALARYVADHPTLARHESADAVVAGIVVLPDGPTLVVSRPILDNRYRLPARGALLMTRLLDTEEIRDIGRRLRLSLTRLQPDDPTVPEGLSGDAVAIEPFDGDRVAAYGLVSDLDGRPAFVLRIDEPADIRRQGTVTLVAVLGWVLLTGIVFAAAVIVLLERTVLTRLHALSAAVLAVGTASQPGGRVPSAGRDAIAYLGAAINGMLESIERATGELRALQQRNEAFLDAIPDLFLRVRRDGTILDVRPPTGMDRLPADNLLVGARVQDLPSVFPPVTSEVTNRGMASIERAIATGVPETIRFDVKSEPTRRTFECRIAAAGPDESIALVRDVTVEVTAEEARRREILLKEIHHRIKNNLQVITSLLALQARSADDPRVRDPLSEVRDRVRSMALIHERLYEAGSGKIGFGEYVRDLVSHIRHSLAGDSEQVEIQVQAEEVTLDLDTAVPAGLVINELATNALRHAFPEGKRGRLGITIARQADGSLCLRVADDGIGLPAEIDPNAPRTLGLRIVDILVRQLKGTLTVERPSGGGTVFSVSFPG